MEATDRDDAPERSLLQTGFVIEKHSRGNQLSNNRATRFWNGFLVFGDDSTLLGNTAEEGTAGFVIFGARNTLEQNVARYNSGYCPQGGFSGGIGFMVYGRKHILRTNRAESNTRCIEEPGIGHGFYVGRSTSRGSYNPPISDDLAKLVKRGARRVLLEDNVASGNSGAGIWTAGKTITLVGNDANGNGNGGIFGSGQVMSNTASFNGGTGIAGGDVLQDNMAMDNAGCGVGVGKLTTGNVAMGNGGDGLCIGPTVGKRRHVVEGNTATFNGGSGLGAEDESSGNRIVGNTLEDNAMDGIRLYGSDKNVVTGNTVRNNGGSGIALRTIPNHGVIVDFDARKNQVRGNTVSGHVAPDFDLLDEQPSCGSNRWDENAYGTRSQECIQ